MYSKALTEESVFKLLMVVLATKDATKDKRIIDHKEVKKLTEKMKIYG